MWSDEFNTPGDFSQWKVYEGDGCETGLCNFGNGELQVYRPGNAVVAGGNLTIATRYEKSVQGGRTYDYTSAKLISKNAATSGIKTFRYGRIEARMKLPSAEGVWPAFWMLAEPNNWPLTGEIDIMEAKHKNPRASAGTIHYDAGGWNFTGREYGSPVDLSLDFHVYSIDWSPDQIKWYVDGNLFHTASPKTTTGNSWPFNNGNFYLMLNAAVGGPGTGFTGLDKNPVASDYPTSTQVDYVRVYNGTYSYAILGAGQVYKGDVNRTYRLDAVPGGTFSWAVPSGATIVGGQGTNTIDVNFGSSAVNGNVTASVVVNGCATSSYSKAITVAPALQLDRVYEDFEANRVVTYASATGTLTQAVNNPSAVVNTSAKVGKYVRNPTEKYDVLSVRNINISNANDFVSGRRKIYVDLYSSAPVGSKIVIQLENSRVATPNNSPLGRHSAYKAFTTRQNAWETLEFSLEGLIDAGTNIYSIDNVTFLFQPTVNSGDTFYFDNLVIKKEIEKAFVTSEALLNYDGTARLTFDASAGTNGAYAGGVANPAAAGVNTSANVGRYVRNASEKYDVLFLEAGVPGTVIEDAGLFKNQTYQFQVDVYSSAPVGTPVNITLQNRKLAAPSNSFPAGRNSTYLANTTKQNQWETLTFAFNSAPDGGTANVAIDQLAVLFNSGVLSGDTYYIDNFRVAKKATATFAPGTTFENYDNVRNTTYRKSDGVFVAAANNPASGGANTSAKVAQYTRKSTATYDALGLGTDLIKDGDEYIAGRKVFVMDVYTSAPVGTVVSWQLENSGASTPTNYPAGRHSVYQSVVKQTNAWHSLTFSYSNSPDLSAAQGDVDTIVLLFAPNTSTGTVFYIDNLRSLNATGTVTNDPPANTAPIASLTSPVNDSKTPSPASITISADAADADGTISKVEFYQGSTLLNTDTTAPYTYTWTGVSNGTYSLTAKATDNAGATTTSAAVSVMVVAPLGSSAQPIPGTIQAESYSAMSGIDKETTTDTGGGVNVDWFETGDWLDYDVNVQTAGNYVVGLRVASANGGAQLQLRNSAGTSLGSVSVENTGGWQNWVTRNVTVSLPSGRQTLRVYAAASTGCNLNWLSFTADTPPLDMAQRIPGTIQAESYTAMQGIQTETTADTGGGLNIGYVDNGDWLDYAVNVQTTGSYKVDFRVASAVGGGQLQLRTSAGATLATVGVNTTGSWQTWTTLSATVNLTAGMQTLRLYATAGGLNINWVSFATTGPPPVNSPPTVSLTSPSNGASLTAPASITISANAADADGTVSKVEFYNGSTLLGTDPSAPYSYTWTGVAAGTYSLTAKATDNNGATTTSAAVSATVTSSNQTGYCATAADFSYRAVTSSGNVTVTFHPVGVTVGGNLAILYLRQGSTGGYPGYPMTKNGAGDFTYTLPVANGTATSLYFTYQVGAGGPERNTAATPFAYTAGTACTPQARASAPSAALAASLQVAPNPSAGLTRISFALPKAEAAYSLALYDLTGRLVRTVKHGQGTGAQAMELNTTSYPAGVYVLRLVTGQQTFTQRLAITH